MEPILTFILSEEVRSLKFYGEAELTLRALEFFSNSGSLGKLFWFFFSSHFPFCVWNSQQYMSLPFSPGNQKPNSSPQEIGGCGTSPSTHTPSKFRAIKKRSSVLFTGRLSTKKRSQTLPADFLQSILSQQNRGFAQTFDLSLPSANISSFEEIQDLVRKPSEPCYLLRVFSSQGSGGSTTRKTAAFNPEKHLKPAPELCCG